MKSIFTYTDYRAYLKDALREKQAKNPSFSYRLAAAGMGIGSGTLSRILNGSRHIGPELLPKTVALLGIKRREAEYFRLLVEFQSTKNEQRKVQCYNELLKMRCCRGALVSGEKYRFFENWYHVALFELLRIVGENDAELLNSLFIKPVGKVKIKKALELLRSLGYITQRPDNKIYTTEPFLTTGDVWENMAVHRFQEEVSKLASEAINMLPKEERDFSTLTMALSTEAFGKVREVIKKARAEIAEIERKCNNPQRVYQINFQCFPLTRTPEEKGKGGSK